MIVTDELGLLSGVGWMSTPIGSLDSNKAWNSSGSITSSILHVLGGPPLNLYFSVLMSFCRLWFATRYMSGWIEARSVRKASPRPELFENSIKLLLINLGLAS